MLKFGFKIKNYHYEILSHTEYEDRNNIDCDKR